MQTSVELSDAKAINSMLNRRTHIYNVIILTHEL